MDRHVPAYEPSPADLSWSAPASSGPLVVHKRRRLAGLAVEGPPAGGTPPADEAPRGPRVFTVRSAPPASPAAGATSAGQPATEALLPKPRRRRDAAHRPGEVTRIVFTAPDGQPAAEAATPAPAPEGSAFTDVNAQLDDLLNDVKRHAYFAHLKFF